MQKKILKNVLKILIGFPPLIAIALSKAVLSKITPFNWRVRLIKSSGNAAINCAQAILSLTSFEYSGYARRDSYSISEPNDAKSSENFFDS